MDFSLLVSKIITIVIWSAIVIFILILISSILSNFFIEVTKYTFNSPKVPAAFNNYKILQISDLHNFSFGKSNSTLLKKVEENNPDIVVMTGDMISTNSKDYKNFYSLAEKMAKKYTTYYIMGNHELRLPVAKQKEIIKQLENFGIKVLNNTNATIEKNNERIKIYGLTEPLTSYKNALKNNTEIDFTIEALNSVFPNINTDNLNILLAHSPFNFEVFSKWGADLVLSGHVHGGLIRLPFLGGLLSPERTFFPKYYAGEYVLNNSKMIVSRGLGNGTINLRVFNNPEICVIKLKSI